MSALKLLCWGFVALLGAGALAIVAGLVSPHEQVNALWLVVAAGLPVCAGLSLLRSMDRF